MKKIIKYTVYTLAFFWGAVIGAALGVSAAIECDRRKEQP